MRVYRDDSTRSGQYFTDHARHEGLNQQLLLPQAAIAGWRRESRPSSRRVRTLTQSRRR